MPGHAANRLQAAVWREAIHTIVEGVESVEYVDKAMLAGAPQGGYGSNMLFQLGAGEAGPRGFCDHFRDTFNHRWMASGRST